MWIARRSPAKAIDPGMLDNLVGGGVAAGQTITTTLIKEAWEEAPTSWSSPRSSEDYDSNSGSERMMRWGGSGIRGQPDAIAVIPDRVNPGTLRGDNFPFEVVADHPGLVRADAEGLPSHGV